MSRYKVLVDSSVWIDFLRSGTNSKLDRLIQEDMICINELIITELLPSINHHSRNDVAESLGSIEKIPLRIDWIVIRELQYMNLKNGIYKVGIPDLIILQQVIEEKILLFSFDEHFKLMRSFLNYELIH
ncbi:PIN domain-containing protein [Pleomorphovibrio marinus]|uniref:PIN domain-containing protein n=1 Tax=Pleomorphovibrio marinus TaxID=2164132 RepID=UPI000E0B9B26|nr:PIN domain-containing protein [Pleomorphovibrio marinus]